MDSILDYLQKLAAIAKAQNDKFRERAFVNASASLKKYSGPIELSSLAKVPGVGKKILERIDIILTTGRLPEVDNHEEIHRLEILLLFQEVPGIGPKKAAQLYDAGYRRLEDLPSTKLTDHQKIGIRYHADLQVPIPRAEIEETFNRIVDVMYRYNNFYHVDLTMMMAGSYRRGKMQSGDMDIVVASRDPAVKASQHAGLLVDYLFDEGIMTEIISKGTTKIMGICKIYDLGRRIDFQIVDDVYCFWSSMLYFTGSKEFNLRMRSQAHQRGWKLNEHGLFDETGRRFDLFDESEYFAQLDMDYLDPTSR